MTGTYDPDTNTVFWGTANPAPDYDLARRPGDNLYTSGVVALDPDTGALKSYFQETRMTRGTLMAPSASSR